MVKRLLYIVILFTVLIPVQAQLIYKPVKLDIGMAFGELTGPHAGFITPYAELKLNMTNRITIGGRYEYVYFSQKDQSIINSATANGLYWRNIESDGYISSITGTCDYYFNTHKLRPFAGVGLGLYYASLNEQNVFINNDETLLLPGAMLRMGFSVEHIRFGIEYNLIPNDVTKLNYLSFKLGFEIGGGKKVFIKP
ncbi:hypothetical protein ACE1ET_19600 [Saccharicrinis sp. FJH62]|uniref:hypothetical protein n=1 Tax=Saccharicrinis sp. FJH62 TaxID=3344657 RepID=UPI0035D421D4